MLKPSPPVPAAGETFATEAAALQTRYETLVPPVVESHIEEAEALLSGAGGLPRGGGGGWEEAAAGHGGALSGVEGKQQAEHAAARHALLADAAQREEAPPPPWRQPRGER